MGCYTATNIHGGPHLVQDQCASVSSSMASWEILALNGGFNENIIYKSRLTSCLGIFDISVVNYRISRYKSKPFGVEHVGRYPFCISEQIESIQPC